MILELDNNYSVKVLKQNYRRLSLIHHPDRKGETSKMQELNNAYEFLYKYNIYSNIGDEELDELFKNTMASSTFGSKKIFEEKIKDKTLRKYFLRKNNF